MPADGAVSVLAVPVSSEASTRCQVKSQLSQPTWLVMDKPVAAAAAGVLFMIPSPQRMKKTAAITELGFTVPSGGGMTADGKSGTQRVCHVSPSG